MSKLDKKPSQLQYFGRDFGTESFYKYPVITPIHYAKNEENQSMNLCIMIKICKN